MGDGRAKFGAVLAATHLVANRLNDRARYDAAERVAARADASGHDEHWITVHPNGKDHKGDALLIEGSSDGGYTVKGGAGGKLNGETITPKSMSNGRLSGASAPAASGREGHEAAYNKSHGAAKAAEEGPTHREHLASAMRSAEQVHEHARKAAEAATAVADATSAGAKTTEQHGLANKAHNDAVTAWMDASNWAKRAENGRAAEAQVMARHHSLKAGEHLYKYRLAQRREENKAKTEKFQQSAVGHEKAQVEKRFEKSSLDDITKHFKDNHGLDFQNGSNAGKAHKAAKKAFYKDWSALSNEQKQHRVDELNALNAAARASGPMPKSHTPHDLTDGSANAKASRKALGHLADALEHLESQGYDVKAALANAPVTFHPGSTGKAIGHAWQVGGRGHLGLSGAKTNDEWHAEQEKRNEARAARGKGPWIVGHDFRTVAIHELAHAIGMQAHVNSPEKLQQTLKALIPDPTERARFVLDNISEYGASNRYETDAELAAKVTHPTYVKGSLPKELEDHVADLFHKRKS